MQPLLPHLPRCPYLNVVKTSVESKKIAKSIQMGSDGKGRRNGSSEKSFEAMAKIEASETEKVPDEIDSNVQYCFVTASSGSGGANKESTRERTKGNF